MKIITYNIDVDDSDVEVLINSEITILTKPNEILLIKNKKTIFNDDGKNSIAIKNNLVVICLSSAQKQIEFLTKYK